MSPIRSPRKQPTIRSWLKSARTISSRCSNKSPNWPSTYPPHFLDGSVNANRLYVRELQVDSGPLLQGRFRYQPGPMGRALPIRKRTSHIHVVLAEREEAKAGGK